MEIPVDPPLINRQQSYMYQDQYKKQFPLCEKITYTLVAVAYCYIVIQMLQSYCINPVCQFPTHFAEIIIYLLYAALLIRIIILISLLFSYISKTALVTTIIFEQKLNEAEFFITLLFLFLEIIVYVQAEQCRTQQLTYAFVFCLTYVLIRLMCLPNGVINYFDGEYL